ncbi:DUF1934 domain-containing protein [Neobacillus sp. SM06]|uniref:DUF1934 domain-containing protein n=1 Tax=Neobacillus sp. SM06 TaxID=3422492 RepID=UPI003D2732C7
MSISERLVKLNVKTTISQQESSETFEVAAVGHFYQKEDAIYLKYEEMTEEGRIRTVVKAAKEEALILRNGSVAMRLPFALNSKKNGYYEIPFGTVKTSTFTKKIDHHYQAESGTGYIQLVYDFSLQGSDAGTYVVQINFQEEEQ